MVLLDFFAFANQANAAAAPETNAALPTTLLVMTTVECPSVDGELDGEGDIKGVADVEGDETGEGAGLGTIGRNVKQRARRNGCYRLVSYFVMKTYQQREIQIFAESHCY